jgi:hypothetical protein
MLRATRIGLIMCASRALYDKRKSMTASYNNSGVGNPVYAKWTHNGRSEKKSLPSRHDSEIFVVFLICEGILKRRIILVDHCVK